MQEPSDFSIICQWDGFPIRAEDSHLGIGWETALDALRLDAYKPAFGLSNEAAEFFWVDGLAEPAGRFGVLLVLDGDGEIAGRRARPGDAFALPASCEPFEVTGDVRVLRFLAPLP